MPTYDYVCTECCYAFEHFQNMSEPKLVTCDKCGGMLERKIGAGSGIIFNGPGFFATDYRADDGGESD